MAKRVMPKQHNVQIPIAMKTMNVLWNDEIIAVM